MNNREANKKPNKKPKKPVVVEYIVDIFGVDKGIEQQIQCPVCGYPFVVRQITKSSGEDEIVYEEWAKHCPDCGQAIEHEENINE